jgi:hypothetical protein
VKEISPRVPPSANCKETTSRLGRRPRQCCLSRVRHASAHIMVVTTLPLPCRSPQRQPGIPGNGVDLLDELPTNIDALQPLCSMPSTGSSRWRVYWHAISHSASHRVGPAWVRRCCAETRAFTPIRCWRPTCANSRSGATGRHVLIAVARYLAAHSPTERAVFAVARMRAGRALSCSAPG